MTLLYIAIGGAIGAVARYTLGGWVQDRVAFDFPLGTLAVNMIGSLLIGFAIRYMEAVRLPVDLRALITIGLLGAFTTFSTLSYETFALLAKGAWFRAGLNAVGHLLLGLGAVYAGVAIAVQILHARG